MHFLGVPLFDSDLYHMIFRFAFNFFSISVIIRWLYYRYTRRTEYVFTFYMVSMVIFFLCFTLQNFTLDLGIALGLFAIFGIIRYRTLTIEIKEMTYLFVVIGMSVINALSNENMSYAELLTANLAIVGGIFLIEKYVLSKGRVEQRVVTYNHLENLKPENYQALVKDLTQKTGLDITEVSVLKTDYANGVTTLTIYYRVHAINA